MSDSDRTTTLPAQVAELAALLADTQTRLHLCEQSREGRTLASDGTVTQYSLAGVVLGHLVELCPNDWTLSMTCFVAPSKALYAISAQGVYSSHWVFLDSLEDMHDVRHLAQIMHDDMRKRLATTDPGRAAHT